MIRLREEEKIVWLLFSSLEVIEHDRSLGGMCSLLSCGAGMHSCSLIFIVSISSLIEFVVNWVSVNYMEME